MGSAMTPEYMRRLLIAPSEPSRNFQVGGVTLLAERMIVRPVTDGHQLHGLFAPSPNKRAPTEAGAPFEPFKAPVRLHLLLFAHFSRSVPCATRLRAIGLCLCSGRSCEDWA